MKDGWHAVSSLVPIDKMNSATGSVGKALMYSYAYNVLIYYMAITYIYIYVEREREREDEVGDGPTQQSPAGQRKRGN